MSLLIVRGHQNFAYALPKEVSAIYRRKNTLARSEDFRVSWDLKWLSTSVDKVYIKKWSYEFLHFKW